MPGFIEDETDQEVAGFFSHIHEAGYVLVPRETLLAAREALPDDPGLDKPWSKCIAILDEAMIAAEERDDG